MPTRRIDTGALRSDLISMFERIARRAEGTMSEALAGVMGEAFRQPEVAALLRDRLRTAPLTGWVSAIVERATERGELPHVEIPPRVGRLPLDLIRNETTIGEVPITDETIAELVDEIYLPLLRGLAGR
jgi:hypothetical protein